MPATSNSFTPAYSSRWPVSVEHPVAITLPAASAISRELRTGLADSDLVLYSYSDASDKERISKARAAATRALQIDATLSEAHTALAYVRQIERDNAESEREYNKAIELNPNNATAYHRYANLQLSTGRPEDALQMIKRAQELDPLSPIINTALGNAYSINHRYDEAIEQLRKTLEMEPLFGHARGFLAMAYLMKRMNEDAIREIEKATLLSENAVPPQIVSYRGYFYAVTGKQAEAKKILEDLTDQRKHRRVQAPHLALICAGLGETDQAFGWLETAYRESELGFGWLNDPGFDGLRSDSRFADLARRIRTRQ